MEKKGKYIGLSSVLLIALLVAVVFGYNQMTYGGKVETLLSNQYYRSFFDLVASVENVRTNLAKCIASGSPNLRVAALSEVWREAGSSQSNLNSLPISQNILMRSSTFLSQVGDYSFVMAKKLGSGQDLSASEMAQLVELKKQSDQLMKDLESMQTDIIASNYNWVGVAMNREANSKLKDAPGNTGAVDAGFKAVDEAIQQIPTMIYDGPFSEHHEKKTALGVVGENIDEEKAKEIALSIVPFDTQGYTAKIEGEAEGRIPVFRVVLEGPKDSKGKAEAGKPSATVDVSKVGGHVTMFTVNHTYTQKSLDTEEGIQKAAAYLESIGLANMIHTFSDFEGDEITVPFVYTQNGVIIYPDLVKVKVALDTGAVIGYEAVGYLMSHRERTNLQPTITVEEASTKLSTQLALENQPRLTLIPTDGVEQDEDLCWEFHGISDGDEFYVYINAQTGQEEEILQIISTDSGKSAI